MALLTLLLGGYSYWWFRLAQESREGLDRWVTARRTAGWTITTGDVTTQGFPGRLRLTLPSPAVTDALGNNWQGPPVTITVSPFDLVHPHMQAPGRHLLSVAGGAPFAVTLADATADLQVDLHGLVSQGHIALRGMDAAGTTLDRLDLSYQRLAEGAVAYSVASFGVTLDAAGLHLPADTHPILGRDVAALHLEARLLGSLSAETPGGVARWRDDGGTVELDTLALSWPPLSLTGKATLALDGNLQPLLAGTATARGLPQTVQSLSEGGLIKPRDAIFAKLALAMLARPGGDGVPEMTVPVTIQDRRLSLGPVGLMHLPELHW